MNIDENLTTELNYLHLDYTKVIILILWWRNFQLEYWRTFQLVSTVLFHFLQKSDYLPILRLFLC